MRFAVERRSTFGFGLDLVIVCRLLVREKGFRTRVKNEGPALDRCSDAASVINTMIQ
jgi:hypothetical protein